MKRIRKIFLFALMVLCVSISFVGCMPYNLIMYKEYAFKEIIFDKSDDLVFADIAPFIPAQVIAEIDTIEEFENYIKDNINTFTFMRKENGDLVTVDARAKDSIKLVHDGVGLHMIVKNEGEEKAYSVVRKGVHHLTNCPEMRFIGAYQGDKNMLVSSIQVTDGFSICYIYEIIK